MQVYWGILIFILGLCGGSFVNMLIYRTARRYGLRPSLRGVKRRSNPPPEAGRHEIATSALGGLAMTESRSFCDFCGKQLSWDENIPVISWLIQKGKSRCCHKKLPIDYPLLELFTGFMFLIYWQIEGQHNMLSLQTLTGLVIITLLIFSTVFDLKYMILPDFSTGILVAIALLGSPHLVSAVGASGFLGLLYIVTKGKGMGLGDVKLGVFLGLFLGWPKIIVALYIAFIGGAIVGIILLALKKVKMKSEIPFGPMLIMATLFTWYYGEEIWVVVEKLSL